MLCKYAGLYPKVLDFVNALERNQTENSPQAAAIHP